MTCRQRIKGIVCFLMLILGMLLYGNPVLAQETEDLPESDILIVYSDDSTVEERGRMMLLVENLTYQNYQVTFAQASDCVGHLADYKSILLYKVERYPKELVTELYEREKEGYRIQEEREGSNVSGIANDVRILFMGNQFLREYLQQTGRSTQYLDCDTQVARMEYAFTSASVMEALVKEEDFLFIKRPGETYGSIEAAGTEGYFFGGNGVLYHIPLTDLENSLICATAFREISQWMWREPFEQYTYAQYIVLNQVYPFQNPEKLLSVVQDLVELEQPFIITVMPIYEHGDYPAMQQFCEVLKYAQANGGMIMIHTPLNQMPEFDAVQVNEALTTAINLYLEQGVYPMGLQVPASWMFRQDTLEVMNRYKTILVAPESDRLLYSSVDTNTNSAYLDDHQWIAPVVSLDTEGISYLTNYSSAVYFDVTEDEEEIQKRLKACMESEVPLLSIWHADHLIQTNQDVISYQNGYLKVNGESKSLDYEPVEYPEEFDYKRNMMERVSKDLTGQNQKLIFAVIAVSILFVGFILIARYRSRKRFFYSESGNPWENQDDEALASQFEKQLASGSMKDGTKGPVFRKYEGYDYPCMEQDDFDIKEIPENDDYDVKIRFKEKVSK